MKRAISEGTSPISGDVNPLKKVIPKRTKLRDFLGCSALKEYEKLEKIGEGTFGVVYKARQKRTNELVALKRILMHNEKDGFPITALREIRILKMLSHPNVIRLSDMTVERGDKAKKKRGEIYMVTPYMDHDLCGLLDNPKVTFSIPQIKCYAKQLLEGTRYLHSMRILHRDMKAANLLISNQGVLQIADFGLARMLFEDPPPGEASREYTNMVVTRWYRPPELLLGERRYTGAIDLWGVGCIIAEMYKGKPIMQGRSDIDQLDQIFSLCGSPTQTSMPGWTQLPGCEGIKNFKSYPRRLEREYASHGESMVHLIGHLLHLDPVTRLTAQQALDHLYFTSDPLPASPSDLPIYEASHEFDKQKREPIRENWTPKAPDAAGKMANGSQKRQDIVPRDAVPPSVSLRSERPGPVYSDSGRSDRPRDDRDRSRDRSRDRPSRPDDRSYRDDRYRDTYSRDSYQSRNRGWDRDRGSSWDRDRERDRNDRHDGAARHSRGDRGQNGDTYIPPYPKSRGPSPPRRDRYALDPRDDRSSRRDYNQDDRVPRQYDRDDRDRRRPRSRSRSRERR